MCVSAGAVPLADSGGSFVGTGPPLKHLIVFFLTGWKIPRRSPREVPGRGPAPTQVMSGGENAACTWFILHFTNVNERCCAEEIAAYFPRHVNTVWQGGCTLTN